MRTTVTLEDDLYVLLERRQAERGESFKKVLNDVVRAGLHVDVVESTRSGVTVEVPSFDLGRPLLANMDNIAEVLALAEGEGYR